MQADSALGKVDWVRKAFNTIDWSDLTRIKTANENPHPSFDDGWNAGLFNRHRDGLPLGP